MTPRIDEQVARFEAGDHLCAIYENEEERRTLLTAWLLQGLKRHEKVIYLADERTAATLGGSLQAEGIDLAPYLRRGQLSVLSSKESYLRDGVFAPDAMIALLRRETDAALREGYSALRVTGEMTWALGPEPGVERLIEYETALNDFFPSSGALALCQYDARRFGPHLLLHVLVTHPLAVIGTEVYENHFSMSPHELRSPDVGGRRLRQWIASLAALARERAALRDSEERYRGRFEAARDGILLVDTQTGEVVDANPSLRATLGLEGALIVGKKVWEVDALAWIASGPDALHELWRKPSSGYRLLEVATPAGRRRNLEVAQSRYAVGTRTLLQCSLRDVTERVQASRQEQAASEETRRLLDVAERSRRALLSVVEDQRRTEQRLRTTLREREVLLREVHHRVKNSLQAIISLSELRRGRAEGVDEALGELAEQARTMALVYEQLYESEDMARVDMGSYLWALCRHLLVAFGRGRAIDLRVEASGETLDVERATPCGLLVNELVTNALKHAFPEPFERHPQIVVSFAREGGACELAVADNGVGMPEGAWSERSSGLRLLTLWATHQLGGTLERRCEGGTRVTVRFGA